MRRLLALAALVRRNGRVHQGAGEDARRAAALVTPRRRSHDRARPDARSDRSAGGPRASADDAGSSKPAGTHSAPIDADHRAGAAAGGSRGAGAAAGAADHAKSWRSGTEGAHAALRRAARFGSDQSGAADGERPRAVRHGARVREAGRQRAEGAQRRPRARARRKRPLPAVEGRARRAFSCFLFLATCILLSSPSSVASRPWPASGRW